MALQPSSKILHLSDLHLIPGEALLYGSADADSSLKHLLLELKSSSLRPDTIVVTGDVADEGEIEAYIKARSILDPFADALGINILWVMGNHDNRLAMRESLPIPITFGDEIDYMRILPDGTQMIILDTSVPGAHYGDLRDSQLEWLDKTLSVSGEQGSIIAMHHPPLPSNQGLAETTELRRQAEFAEVLKGKNVRTILAGHMHYSCFGTFAGIPVSVAASTCYNQDLMVRGVRGQAGGESMNLVQVFPETVTHSIITSNQWRTVGEAFTEADVTRILDAHRNSLINPIGVVPDATTPIDIIS